MFTGAKQFKIVYERADVELFTRAGAKISKSRFENVIELSGGFFSVDLNVHGMNYSAVVTPKVSFEVRRHCWHLVNFQLILPQTGNKKLLDSNERYAYFER